MILRKFGKLLLGKATPFHIMTGTLLGALLGFGPGFGQGPGMVVLLVALLVLVNANLLLAAITGLVASALAWALLPVSFQLGRLLLDGPTQAIFKALTKKERAGETG